MNATIYKPTMAQLWDGAVRASRNGTFLFERAYMDYHSNRFTDASLLFRDESTEEILGLFPANLEASPISMEAASSLVVSHGGLTYGGLVLSPKASLTDVRDMLKAAAEVYTQREVRRLLIKPIPHIYHRYPCEEELYWLFRAGATLEARTASTAIRLDSPCHKALWHRKTKKKACEGLTLHEGDDERLRRFWDIVEEVLSTRHATRPVHSVDEISLLTQRFPQNIRIFTVDNADGKIITGAVVFITATTAHIQYMEAGEEARRRRALDWLIEQLIPRFAADGLLYLDFGISTEDGGRYLNEGLAYQKEGFGGRTVCYDAYSVSLDRLLSL